MESAIGNHQTSTASGRQGYRARWVFPVDAEPIENGTVEVEDGQITAVHAARDPQAVDLGNAALIPALVNAHTHLEFSDLTEPIRPPQPFTGWIRALLAHRHTRPASSAETIARGLCECRESGTALVGEITTGDPSSPPGVLAPQIVLFRELLGLRPDQAPEQLAIAREHLEAGSDVSGPIVRRGISPHAPYSVHPDLFDALVDLAAEHRAPLAIHLAETRAELQLLEHGTGEFVKMLQDFGVWQAGAIPRGTRPLDYLRPLAKLDPDRSASALILHGNYLSDEEIEFVAGHPNLAVVYCPRTHAYFGHAHHPWQELLRQGGTVALGTDSRASNPDLSLWKELLFLRARHPQVDPRKLLELGTIAGARALGCEHQAGTLTPGKPAHLAVVSLSEEEGSDPFTLLFAPQNRIAPIMQPGSPPIR